MTTKHLILNQIESENRQKVSLVSKKRAIQTDVPHKLKPFIQLILLIALLFLVTSCTSSNTSEDSIVSAVIKELNSQRNLTIYDEIERIVFTPDNSEHTLNDTKIIPTPVSEHNLNRNLSNENKFPTHSVHSSNEMAVESDRNSVNNGSLNSLAPKIIAPLVISLKVGEPLKLDYHVYDLDSDYIKVWIDGWVNSDNYQTKKGDEGVHSVYIYASDYESTTKTKLTINVIREQKLSDVKITHQII